jgi:serine/threonine-protein kinase
MRPRRASAAGELPPGYELVRVIGHGGSGRVVLARDLRLERLVAIKTVYGGTLDGTAVARLRREGQALATVAHPNIARVYDLRSHGPDVYVIMEYVDGGDLDQALRHGSLAGCVLVRVLLQTAAALDHAADRGIVHRDVKPSNILISSDGQAKLADFGLARLPRASGAFRTAEGVASGTPSFMAPEQIDGSCAEHPAFDAFAYAAVVYLALTGTLPFAGSSSAQRASRPRSPRELQPGLPRVVDAAILAGLEPQQSRRATVGEVAAALAGITSEQWDLLLPVKARSGSAAPNEHTVTDDHQAAADTAMAAPTFPAPQPIRQMKRGYVVPGRRLSQNTAARVVGIAVGLAVGLTVALLLLH